MEYYRDKILEEIDAPPTVKTNREGHTIETYKVNGVEKYFVYIKDSTLCAHGSTIAEAITDALWKDPKRRPSMESLVEEIRAEGPERKIYLNEFRLLTGACAEGCRVALQRANKEPPLTAREVRDFVSREWGEKLIKILGWEEIK